MASVTDTQYTLSRRKLENIAHSPGDTALNAVKYVDMQDFRVFVAGYFRTVGTGTTLYQISAAQDASGTNKQVIKVGTKQPDGVGDQAWLEVNEQEIAQVGVDAGIEDLKFVTLEVQLGTGTDDAVVTYIQDDASFPGKDLTADVIA